jgi:thioredoxin reductase (NADPH)
MGQMRAQAERFGAVLVSAKATRVELHDGGPQAIWYLDPSSGHERQVQATALILATGARALMLGVPNERELLGYGVSTCATCDGFFFRGQHIAVVGGGDSAIEEATFLTKFADSVTVVHRRGELRASKIMQDRATSNPKISFAWDSEVAEVLGEDRVSGLRLRNLKTGEESTLAVTGIFVAIGHDPRSELFTGKLATDPEGYLLVEQPSTRTAIDGVFAAGDVVDRTYRQAVTAAGSGCAAALDAERWLADHEA